MSEQVIIKGKSSFTSENIDKLQDVKCGAHIQDFIDYQKINSGLDATDTMRLRNSACDILSYCNPHNAVNNIQTTHLVVGYVQSGKTMSFTSLIELALDNHYKLVIVLAGITSNLLKQTDDRLGEDLICGEAKKHKFFKIHKNPGPSNAEEIARNLKLKDSIVVINVLKHPGRITNVSKIFENEAVKTALANETVIIIDDEADQASLNNYGRANSKVSEEEAKKMSSTYEAILTLRNKLDGNSYVQYTATPQANILINTVDMLSPKTHTLLYPGKGYCGGKLFFGYGDEGKRFGQSLLYEIPEDEVFNAKVNALDEIPESLKHALMLQVWAVIINTKHFENVPHLSMMVHTDVTLHWNSVFYNWINDTLTKWSSILDEDGMGVNKFLLLNKFKKAYEEATKLYEDKSSFSFEGLSEYIPEVLNDTHVYLITGDTNDAEELDWDQHSSNILVGAQMLNRGFTVKNLATTYMPRYALGNTNADTIEQRCRFFGYKEKYIRSCRVFLPKVSIENYTDYISSEEELRMIMGETHSLAQCGHKILSYPKLKPTRANVLPASVVSTKLTGMKEFSPYDSVSIMKYNLEQVDLLIQENDCKPFKRAQYDYSSYDPDGYRAHSSFRIPVDVAVGFLKRLQLCNTSDYMAKGDTIRYLLYLKESKIISEVEVVNMSEGKSKERSLDVKTKQLITSSGKESNIFNGPSSSTEGGTPYLGDRAMYVEDTITIQLHHLAFVNLDGFKASSIAIHYPEHLAVKYTTTC